jgi:uncharacterized protein YfbU (UPF0304 family)
MELTRKDRWILSNQLRILEKLEKDKGEREVLERWREAIEKGYELEYSNCCEHIYDDEAEDEADSSTLTTDECREALDIMSMFDAVRHSIEKHGLPKGVEKWHIEFSGYDFNDIKESSYASYSQYFCRENRFVDLTKNLSWNSHSQRLPVYRRQMAEWRKAESGEPLTEQDVINIAAAAIHPNRRSGS